MSEKTEVRSQESGGRGTAGADIAHSAMSRSHHEPAQLPIIPAEWQGAVEELLIAGCTVEEVVETVNAQGGPEIPTGAVESHFRRSPALQRRRAQHLVEAAEQLRAALGNPQADHALVQLANAALMSGYLGLTRKNASLTIKDAECIRLARQNLKLRKRILRIKELNEERAHQLNWRRLRYEDVKYDTAVEKLKQLRQQLRTLMAEGKLESGTLEKIREIYGIIKQPFIPPEIENPAAAPSEA